MNQFVGRTLAAWLTVTSAAAGFQPTALPTTRPPHDDLAEGRRLLAEVRDHVFGFDDPAFYWFCRYLAPAAGEPTSRPDAPLTPWRFLMERPSDYRGERIAVEGVLQQRVAFTANNRLPGLTLYQSTLAVRDTRALATIVTIDDPGDIPLRSRVRADGFFIKVRSFATREGVAGTGPLIVARRLRVLDSPAGGMTGAPWAGTGVARWLVGATGVLLIGWLGVRIWLRKIGPAKAQYGRAASAPRNSDDDFDWLTDDRATRPQDPNPPV